MTLTDFLLARIAEDEAQAQQAIAERIRVTRDGAEPDWRFDSWPDLGAPAVVVGGERVLAECEAKRRIVEAADEATGLDMQVDHEFRIGSRNQAEEPYIGDVILRALALPYADHPECRDEWRP